MHQDQIQSLNFPFKQITQLIIKLLNKLQDHLWNDELWIKSTPMPTFVKVVSSKFLILLSTPTWGVGSILPM